MPKRTTSDSKAKSRDSFEATLWQAADKLRKNMDAAEYKHVVLGLIFLKYISDAFEELHNSLVKGKGDYEGANPEDPNEYTAEKVFFVPPIARWNRISDNAKKTEILLDNGKKVDIGGYVDEAMEAIERQNASLKGVLPKVYARQNLDRASLGGLIDLVGTIALGTKEAKSKDVLGQVYEYFLGQFALAEGKKGGQFYTPRAVVKLLVEMLEPYEGRVFDPCCGSGGMFVQSEKFIEAHQDHYKKKDKGIKLNPADMISIYGQESNQTTWRLAKMNLAIRGIDSSNIKWNNEGSFLNDAHKDLKADYIIANPPFNDGDWAGDQLRKDARWVYGLPPVSNANFAWMQHFIYHLSLKGNAGIVLADSSMTTTSSDESLIRQAIVKGGLVDCMVSLPSHLFSNTQITACLWFLSRDKGANKRRNRQHEILFIDASKLGTMAKRKSRILTDDVINKIASTYHNWRNPDGNYHDIAGFCRTVNTGEVESNNFVLSPNRYISTLKHDIELNVDINDKAEPGKLDKESIALSNGISSVVKAMRTSNIVRLCDVVEIISNSIAVRNRAQSFYDALIKKYFLDLDIQPIKSISFPKKQKMPDGWHSKPFGELFTERKLTVDGMGHCPPIYSVTNLGIQAREDKYTKELSKSTLTYKVAFRGDIVFGLSREIPNFDVLKDEQGAFSPAYIIFMPKDIRIGFIIGSIMRLKLMEQTDILKGGAREGRCLDKDKLLTKCFSVPSEKHLDLLWGKVL
jgi:type I restriction enzyme M protein